MSTGDRTYEERWRAPIPTDRHEGLETLTASVRRLVEATVATGVDGDELVALAAEVDAVAAQLETSRDDDPWKARSYGPGLPDPSRLMGINPAMGACNPAAPDLRMRINEDLSITGTVRFRLSHVGPPYRAHGGTVALVLDQVLGFAVIAARVPGMTASMTVKYRAATPLDTELRVEARVVHAEGRRSRVTAQMFDEDGNVTAEAEGLFVMPKGGHHER